MREGKGRETDPRILERREFLRRLGIAGAAGAGYLTLGRLAHAAPASGLRTPDGMRTPVLHGSFANRPFYMLSLGDSVMWGQGLAEHEKFRNQVRDWLRANLRLQREVVAFNYSHSGAILTHGQARAEERQGSEAESWGGEIGRNDPTVARQVGMAVDGLRMHGVDPQEVDLILMNGGANDLGFLATIINPQGFGQHPELGVQIIRQRVSTVAGPRMRAVLPLVLERFPRAKVVLTGYYTGVTVASLQNSVLALGGMVQLPLSVPMIPMIVRNNAEFVQALDDVFAEVASEVGSGRVIHVTPKFGVANGIGAPESFVWDFAETDPVEGARRRECHTLFALGKQSLIDKTFSCDEANTFHPNVRGAGRYTERIIAALTPVLPEWTKLQQMTARVEGTPTAADAWPITVSAVDRDSGAPVSGTVSLPWTTPFPTNRVSTVTMCRMEQVRADRPVRPTAEQQEELRRTGEIREVGSSRTELKRVCGGRGLVRAPGYIDVYVTFQGESAGAAAERARLAEEQRQRAAAEEEARRRAAAEAEAKRRAEEEARRRAAAEAEAKRQAEAERRQREAATKRPKGARPVSPP